MPDKIAAGERRGIGAHGLGRALRRRSVRRASPRRGRCRSDDRPARMMASSCSTTSTVLPCGLQIAQGVDQPLVVARVQADRGSSST